MWLMRKNPEKELPNNNSTKFKRNNCKINTKCIYSTTTLHYDDNNDEIKIIVVTSNDNKKTEKSKTIKKR